MKRILITGINGFLANRLVDYLGGNDSNIFGISRSDNFKTLKKERYTTLYGDILDYQFLCRAISDNEITHIYHLAAQSIVRIANTNPLYCFTDNIIGTTNVLEAIRQINPKIKCIVASSDKSYGDYEHLPYTEDMALQSGDSYSTSKACADLITQSYFKTYGLAVNIIRSANIYGAGDMNLSRIIPNTITKILKGEKPVIYSGVWDYKREFIYIDDVCEAYVKIAEHGNPGEAYNAGTSFVYKVGDIVEKICEKMKWTGGIDIIQKSFPEIKTQYLSSKKISELCWSPKVSIDDGLQKTIDWYKNNFQ